MLQPGRDDLDIVHVVSQDHQQDGKSPELVNGPQAIRHPIRSVRFEKNRSGFGLRGFFWLFGFRIDHNLRATRLAGFCAAGSSDEVPDYPGHD
jgi:hypothetical protein